MEDKHNIHEEASENTRCGGHTIRQLLEALCVCKQGIFSEQTLFHYSATIPDVLADFMDREFTSITYEEWLTCRTRLATTDRRDGTHRRKWDTVRGLAKFAAEECHYPSTVDYIENFRVRSQKLVPYIDPIHVRDFLGTVDDPVLYVLYALDFATALRLGEITALEPSDVDLTQHRLSIDKECRYNLGDGWKILYYTKTRKSTAFVEFPSWLVEPLRTLISLGHRFVFDRGDDTPIRSGRINYQLKRYARLAGFPEISMKGLRKTCACYLDYNAVPVNGIAAHLRHTDPRTTERYYLDRRPHTDPRARIAMEAFPESFKV